MEKLLATRAKQFASLGSIVRLQIINHVLQQQPFCDLTEKPVIAKNTHKGLAELMNCSTNQLTKHIENLKGCNILTCKRKGKFLYLFTNDNEATFNKNFERLYITEVITNKELEPAKFDDMIEFISLHGVKLTGKTNIGKSKLRAYFLDRDFSPIRISLQLWDKKIVVEFIRKTTHVTTVLKLIEKFCSL